MPEASSQRVLEVRRRVIGRVRTARSAVGSLAARVTTVMSDPRLSLQGRQEEVERIVGEERGSIEEELAGDRRDIEFVVDQAERHLEELTQVTPEILATRAAVLSPVLHGAMERPEVLLNAYRRRFGDLTDRRLLEEGAQAVIDGLGGSDGGNFAERWRSLQDELAVQRPPEERQALADRSELSELAAYLDAAERVVQADLAALGTEETSGEMGIARAFAVAEVNRYESTHGFESSQPQP